MPGQTDDLNRTDLKPANLEAAIRTPDPIGPSSWRVRQEQDRGATRRVAGMDARHGGPSPGPGPQKPAAWAALSTGTHVFDAARA